ncbi:SDR family NAD(P)-dependent oxidoreductase [Oricola thermophila]|uniref:SDR family oxidoreductase n=1 Tax=Oricola thermophila TaxID=2742145 RepID=A0A6N1VLE0_9HYPH|nr:SDR family oxidoreductase [Oricola thermophila]QKV20029.1 SDR family oxidoreductase [Oricola thermophila]
MQDKRKSVLITGAGSGIGKAVALRFNAEGYGVCLFDLNEEAVREVAGELNPEPGSICFAGSVTEPETMNKAVSATVETFGGIDCVVTSAGIVSVEPAVDADLDKFRQTLEVNVIGTWLAAQAAGRVMIEQGHGSIIMIGSVYGSGGAPQRTAYCASKGAVHNLVQSLAVEWGPYGVRVNAVAPTGVRTPMVQDLIDRGIYNLTGVQGRTPLGRLAEPEEIAAACFYLAGADAGFTTGHVLPVDGGWLANGYILG